MSDTNNIVAPSDISVNTDILDDPTLIDPDASDSGDNIFSFDDPTFQRELVSTILTDPDWLAFGSSWIKPNYLTERTHRLLLTISYAYHKEYKTVPTISALRTEINQRLNDKRHVPLYLAELECTIGAYMPGMDSKKYIRDKMIAFAKTKASQQVFHKFLSDCKSGKTHPGKLSASLAKQLQSIEERLTLDHSTYALGERIDSNRPEWLITGLIRRNTIAVLFGESGSRKTWIALDLALSVATGTPFLGRFPVKQGKVFYVISEGADDFEFRAKAWSQQNKIDPPSIENFAYRPGQYDFSEPSAVEQLICHINERMGGADLVFIDTLAKNFNKDSDTNEGMTIFLSAMETIREKTGATVVPIHHTGWSNTDRERGGRSLRDGCDTSILVVKDDEQSIMRCKKQKLGQEFADVPIIFDIVRMPEYDTPNEEITALVGRYCESSGTDQLPALITTAFESQDSFSQGKLVKTIQNAWKGTPPGRDKLRLQIDALLGEMLVKESKAGAFTYKLL